MDVRGKFGKHMRSVRVPLSVADSSSCFLTAPQTFQVHAQLDIRTVTAIKQLLYDIADTICPHYNNRALTEN